MPHPVYEIDNTTPISDEELRLTELANREWIATSRLFFLRVRNQFTKRPITRSQLEELTTREYNELFKDLAQTMRDLLRRRHAIRIFEDWELPKHGRIQ